MLFPPPGDLPNPGIEPTSLMSPALAGGFQCPLVSPRVNQRKLQKGNLPLELSDFPSCLLAVLPQGNGVFAKGSGFAHH